MTLVVIESPYAGDVKTHTEYANRAIRDSINRGEHPFASHILYTQALQDCDPDQRKTGINCGYSWGKHAKKIAVYTDYGISNGMQQAMGYYNKIGIPIEYRKIGKNMEKPISIVVFKWKKDGYRTKFTADHVNRFFRMIDRHVTVPHRKICITDDFSGIDDRIEKIKLWPNPCPRYGNEMKPNCFYRLRMFDPEIKEIVGDKFCWFDLDAVIVGNIDHILTDQSDFRMWRVDGEFMPCNGSLCLHTVGTRSQFWKEFRADKVHPVTGLKAAGFIGSDQAYLATKMTQIEKDNGFGKADGIYSYRCHLKKRGIKDIPEDCKILFFHGLQNPWDDDIVKNNQWAKEYMSI